jgi:hypothetical protein
MPTNNPNYNINPELPDDEEEEIVATTPEELAELVQEGVIAPPRETPCINVEQIMAIWGVCTGMIISLLFLGLACKPIAILASPYMLLALGIFDTGNTIYRWHTIKSYAITSAAILSVIIPACSMTGCYLLSINNFFHDAISQQLYTFNSIAGPLFFVLFFSALSILSFYDVFKSREQNVWLTTIKGSAANLGISVVLFGFLLPAICKATGVMSIVKSMASQSSIIFSLGTAAVIIILAINTYINFGVRS